ncbi:hypothetical protein FOTG_07294 [Fusarium oxysporum f. sp. vasinfectum 25433]|uniref:Uncharacterized protein n=1 Tax=Fusarium oxysporum f. sp. vasinfectum 25433 TaxID=1089449 RepID=X0LJY2_FUSOX|nr:hypothetical protein FOTG_07294 [Fusarium oxysporum f. sp. vasinfectum 25433]
MSSGRHHHCFQEATRQCFHLPFACIFHSTPSLLITILSNSSSSSSLLFITALSSFFSLPLSPLVVSLYTMEKPFAGQWLYDDEDLAPVNVLWKAIFCPCIVYGRSKKSYGDAVNREYEYDSPPNGHVRLRVSKKGIVDTHEEY